MHIELIFIFRLHPSFDVPKISTRRHYPRLYYLIQLGNKTPLTQRGFKLFVLSKRPQEFYVLRPVICRRHPTTKSTVYYLTWWQRALRTPPSCVVGYTFRFKPSSNMSNLKNPISGRFVYTTYRQGEAY